MRANGESDESIAAQEKREKLLAEAQADKKKAQVKREKLLAEAKADFR